MPGPLEDIRFLSDSENRFTALSALAEGSLTRAELRRTTDASAATISRLLGDFESRGWLVRDEDRYALTPLGEFVATRFVELHEHMTTAHELRDLLPWFPLAELDVGFDLGVLTGARVTAATPENPMAPVARVLEIERESSWTNTLANRFPRACIDARYEAIVEGSQSCELVLTHGAVAAALESPNADKFEDIVAAEGANVYVSEDDAWPGGIFDGTAYLIVANDEDVNVGIIESDDPALLERVEATFDEFREGATRLTRTALQNGTDTVGAEM